MSYRCACGYETDNFSKLGGHIRASSKLEPGRHRPVKETKPKTEENKPNETPPATGTQVISIVPKSEVSPTLKTAQTKDISRATIVRFVPLEIKASPRLLYRAMEVAVNEWGWPPDISVEDFLDTVLYRYCRDRGVILLEYRKEE